MSTTLYTARNMVMAVYLSPIGQKYDNVALEKNLD